MPRLGFAYGLNPKTVIRGGYGMFYIPNYVSFGTNPYIDPVSSATSNFFASTNSGFSPSSSLSCTFDPGTFNCLPGTGPFAPGPTLVPVAGRNPQPNVSQYAVNQSNFSATGYTVQKYGYVQQWNLGFQRELPGGWFADVAYAGSHGVHLPQFNTNINQIPDSFIHEAARQDATGQSVTIGEKFCPTTGVLCPEYPFSQVLPGALGPNVVRGQLDRPYPQYAGLNLNGQGCCGSTYNSLQATVTKRFSGGGSLLVAYTNSKLLSNTDTLTSWLEGGVSGGVGGIQDWNNLAGERSLSSQDVSQRLAISYVIDLPFGKGKKYMGGASGVTNTLISGWGVNGITILQRGFPVKINFGQGTPLSSLGLGIGGLRPDVVPGCDKNSHGSSADKLNAWFNTDCFVPPGNYAFGDESRVDATLRQDGAVNFDFAIFKKTYIGERADIEFRTEFFNLFNHPQFGPPNGTCCIAQPVGNFGTVTNTINNPRLIQFALKFEF
jgi:hypothetical protein